MRLDLTRRLAALVLPAMLLPLSGVARPAPIYITGEATGDLSVWNATGKQIDSGETNYNISDEMTVGDVDGDGADEIIIAGDVSDDIDIYELGDPTPKWTFDSTFTINDGLASGDVLGADQDEIIVAGEVGGYIDIYNRQGVLEASWHGDFTPFDGLAVGNVDGVGKEEILIAGEVSGDVDIFSGDGTLITTFTSSYNVADGFAVGDLDADGIDEIVVAGDYSGDIDIYSMDGTLLAHWNSSFHTSDGFAIGDVDEDGRDEIVIAGDATNTVDIYDMSGTLERTWSSDYTIADGFAVGRNGYPDRDGDGLLDEWETIGFDADGDGTIDLDLPGMGADPDHKDLFLEFDWMPGHEPRRAAVQRMIAAFAVAPIDAGGVSNPDGQPGITLHVDTNTLTDPTAFELGAPTRGTCEDGADNDNDGFTDGLDADSCRESDGGSCRNGMDDDGDGWTDIDDGDCVEGRNSCSDNVDNDGDGLTDEDDVGSCQVGDALGGGNQVAAADCLDSVFFATKQANFADVRRRIFRYAISANGAGLDCGGGLGEVGGNDFLEFNHDGGTIMHELGHNLGLRHGGNDTKNCKPNYVSGMNYDNQFNIRRADGTRIIDYSPALRSDGTRGGNLPALDEASLIESNVMDPAETSIFMVYSDGSDDKVTALPSGMIDWDGDGATDGLPITLNIDDVSSDGDPEACDNATTNGQFTDFDDWTNISLGFRGDDQYEDGSAMPPGDREMTLDELLAHERSLNTTDLSVDASDSADPAIAGTTVTFTLTATNAGKNFTSAASLRATIPAGFEPVSLDGCHWSPGLITCDVGFLAKGRSRSWSPVFAIASDLVHLAGAPVGVSVGASIVNAAGGDPIAVNNAGTEPLLVKAEADLSMTGVVTTGVPAEVLIGVSESVSVEETLASGGPSSPMDALVTRTASADAGASVALSDASELVPAVVKDSVRTASATLQVGCALPGVHGFQVGSTIAPARPDDADPNATNDHADASFSLECVQPVSIRILPRTGNGRKGVIPVEIRSNEAGEYGLPLAFDASSILATTVRFGTEAVTWANAGGASEVHGTTHGGEDRVLHFGAVEAALPDGEPQACVKGSFTGTDGNTYKFFGCDVLR